MEILHEEIQLGDQEQVKTCISNYVADKYAFNGNNESAVATAVKNRRCEIYELLLASGFMLGPNEDINQILKEPESIDDIQFRKKLSKIHIKLSKNSVPKHLVLLSDKSKLSYDSKESDRQTCQQSIMKSFESLNGINLIEPLLKFAAKIDNLTIIFDFGHDSVENIDLTSKNSVRGTTLPKSSRIYIGAKRLLDASKNEALATLAHEVCHLVVEKVLENDCKPYRKDDIESEKEFNGIFNDCKTNQNFEDVIKFACEATKDQQHAEMIARVPHLLALYKDDSQKLMYCYEIFNILFQFYQENVLEKVKQKLKLMEAQEEIDEVNDLIGYTTQMEKLKIFSKDLDLDLDASQNVLLLISNCCELTMKTIHRQNLQNEDSGMIFATFEALDGEKVFEQVLKTFGLCISPTLVINCEHANENEINSLALNLYNQQIKTRIIFIAKSNFMIEIFAASITETDVKHTWYQLAEESQIILLNYTVNFQGQEMKLKNLFRPNSTIMNSIPLDDLINKRKIKIGNELKFDEMKFYIERKFLSSTIDLDDEVNDDLEQDAEDLLFYCEHNKLTLLSDKPGNGKTTELKMMALKMKQKFQSKWIMYMDLKKYTFAYEKSEDNESWFQSKDDVMVFMSQRFLKLNKFDEKVFNELFNEFRVVILFDGFDEIAPNYKKFLLALIKKISECNIHSWVSTRTHLENELQKEFSTIAYRLKSLTKDNQGIFFAEFLLSKGFLHENIQQNVSEIQSFVDSLENLSTDLAFNPLLMQMIADIYGESFDLTSIGCNFFSIYVEFVSKMLSNSMNKGPVVQQDISRLMWQVKNLHQTYALSKVFHKSQDINELIDISFDDTEVLSQEHMLRIGLMFCDSFGNMQFIHQTFAEFFVADFIRNNLFNQKLSNPDDISALSNFLAMVFKQPDYKMIRTFTNNAFASFEIKNSSRSMKFLRKVFENMFEDECNVDIFFLFVEENLLNLIKLISFCLKENLDLLSKLWHHKNSCGFTLWVFSIEFQTVEFTKSLANLAEECLDLENLKVLIFNTCAFAFACDIQLDKIENLFDFFVKKLATWLTREEKYQLLCSQGDEIINLFRNASAYQSLAIDKDLLRVIGTHWGFPFVRYIFQSKSTKDNETSLLYYVCNHCTISDLNSFCERLKLKVTPEEFRCALKKPSQFGVTPMMFAATNRNENAFKVFHFFAEIVFSIEALKNILMEEDDKGWTVLHWAVRNEEAKNFEEVKNLYNKLFKPNELREIVVKLNDEYENVLFVAMRTTMKNQKTVEVLWAFLKEIFDDESLKNLLMMRNKMKKTIFSLASTKYRALMPFVEKNFNAEEMKEIEII